MNCADCGHSAELLLKMAGAGVPLCPACLDARFPGERLGSAISAFVRNPRPVNQCPYCGWTQERLNESDLAGCPLCYQALGIVPTGT
jgi:hypothetical protein